jgi:circadian clock protein KaiC
VTVEADVFQAPRVPSGVPGLDAILGGGFVSGGTYILRGAPGAGKTIFANQACFRHAARGGRALYVTLLAESPTRMLRHMAGLGFFDPAAVPSRVYYVSALDTLSQDGPPALLGLLRAELARTGATLLVLDGLFPAAGGAGGGGFDRPIRRFLGELQDHTVKAGCVALVLDDGGLLDQGADAVVDGLIALEDTRRGAEARRHLEVAKFRGSAFLRGRHTFRITDGGIVVYPRIDALLEQRSARDEGSGGRLSAGVPELDAMLGGGLPSGTSTLLLGAAGAGKTTLGVHFLGRSSREEPGLHLGFYETPGRLSQNAASMGVGLGALAGRGDLELLWFPTTGQILDDIGGRLLEAVRRRGVRRLFVDGLGGYVEAADSPERAGRVFAALVNELRAQGVTTVYTAETQNVVGPEVVVPIPGVSVVVDNLVLLRFAEYRARLHRLLSIIKVRGSVFDPAMREFRITGQGIALADTFATAESILSGYGTERRGAGDGQPSKPGRNPSRTPPPAPG